MSRVVERADIAALLEEAASAQQRGNLAAAADRFRAILSLDPKHAISLNALGMQALNRGEAALAVSFFDRAAHADPQATPLWMNLATAARQSGDDTGEARALDRVLAIDQRHLMGNVRRAELHERMGEENSAAFRWGGVAQVIEAMNPSDSRLSGLLAHAKSRVAARAQRVGTIVDDRLADARRRVDPVARRRFDTCVDAMLGRRRIYPNVPHGVHFPFLPANEFFDRGHFPWLAELEACTESIRNELTGLLQSHNDGFKPYVAMEPGAPINKWTPLDRSLDWSSRYLWKFGVRQDESCDRCPSTAEALARVPLADIPGKGPTAFFSILKPGARLPAHTGVSNIRSVVHLPLIVPEGCGFRVGGETRPWVPGKAFVFDDTIEHEAWNNGVSLRAVLIFDVWNPHLTEEERHMLKVLFAELATLEDLPTDVGAVSD